MCFRKIYFDLIFILTSIKFGKSSICRFLNEDFFNNASNIRYFRNFDSPVFRKCHISFVNPRMMESEKVKKLWIAFIGDSRLRSPFLFMASQLSGNEMSLESENYHLGFRYLGRNITGMLSKTS